MAKELRSLLTVWVAWLVLMAGANFATPLYAVYAERFHFSSLVLTAIFATYAIVLVPALVVFGRLSDRIGRRRVILLGLAAAVGGLVLFAAAQGEVWLFAAQLSASVAVVAVALVLVALVVAAWQARTWRSRRFR